MLGSRRAATTGTPWVTALPRGTWTPWTATIGTTTWGSARTWAARAASNLDSRVVGCARLLCCREPLSPAKALLVVLAASRGGHCSIDLSELDRQRRRSGIATHSDTHPVRYVVLPLLTRQE